MEKVKSKWKYLRDNFRKELAKLPVSHSGDSGGEEESSRWPHFKTLLFLKDQFIPRRSTGNLTNKSRTTSSQDNNEVDGDSKVFEETS